MKLSDISGYVVSIVLLSLIFFSYGDHPTVDAIIVTLVWILLLLAAFAIGSMSIVLYGIRSSGNAYDKRFAEFYKGLSNLHGNFIKRAIGYVLIGVWMYAFILHEWTVTAVFYVILTIYIQLFIYFTKDLKKDYFHGRLKGEGLENG